MWKLDLHIGNVNSKNNALINWPVSDLSDSIKNWVSALLNTVAPSLKVAWENTAHLATNIPSTIFNKSNWWKLFKTIPAVWADVLMKAKSLPFKTLDLWIQYVVNNNLERIVWAAKGITTDAVGNWINSNWETKHKSLQVTGDIIKWTWDLVWSILKVPTWLIGLWANKLNKYVWDFWIQKTEKWVNDLRVSDKDYLNTPVFENSWDKFTQVKNVNFWKNNTSANDNEATAAA